MARSEVDGDLSAHGSEARPHQYAPVGLISAYEQERLLIIQANQAWLKSLGLADADFLPSGQRAGARRPRVLTKTIVPPSERTLRNRPAPTVLRTSSGESGALSPGEVHSSASSSQGSSYGRSPSPGHADSSIGDSDSVSSTPAASHRPTANRQAVGTGTRTKRQRDVTRPSTSVSRAARRVLQSGSFCKHFRKRSCCARCGGVKLCAHKRRKNWCRDCNKLSSALPLPSTKPGRAGE